MCENHWRFTQQIMVLLLISSISTSSTRCGSGTNGYILPTAVAFKHSLPTRPTTTSSSKTTSNTTSSSNPSPVRHSSLSILLQFNPLGRGIQKKYINQQDQQRKLNKITGRRQVLTDKTIMMSFVDHQDKGADPQRSIMKKLLSRTGQRSQQPITPTGMKEALALRGGINSVVNEAIYFNILQFLLFVTVNCLMRVPSIATWTANAFRIFPHKQMFDYEPMSMLNWAVHYSTVVFNYDIFLKLVQSKPSNSSSQGTSTITSMAPLRNQKRKLYAIITNGLGHLFGMTLLMSHSLIGTGSVAQQALHNFSHFWMQVSAMALGPLLLFPLSLGVILSSLVVYFNLNGYLSFTNLPGIVLSNLSMLSVLVSPSEVFPTKFKIGHTMLSLGFIPVGILDKKLGGGTDIAHNLGALWLASCMLIVKWSLNTTNDKNALASLDKLA